MVRNSNLAETLDEENFCIEKYGRRPFELMEDLEWVGNDVWFAHGIFLNDREINNLKGSGIAHCPSSNMKLNSGICRTTDIILFDLSKIEFAGCHAPPSFSSMSWKF